MQFVLWFCVSSGWFSVISMWLLGDSVIFEWFLCAAMWFCLILCVLVWCEFVRWCMIFCDFSVISMWLLGDSARLYLDFVWFLCGVICVIVYASLWFWCDALWFLCDFAWLLFCVILCLRLAVLRHSWRQIANAAKELLHFRSSQLPPTQWRCAEISTRKLQILAPKFWICLWPTQLSILMSENILKQHIQTNPLDRTHCPLFCWATCESMLLIDDCPRNAILLQHATV